MIREVVPNIGHSTRHLCRVPPMLQRRAAYADAFGVGFLVQPAMQRVRLAA